MTMLIIQVVERFYRGELNFANQDQAGHDLVFGLGVDLEIFYEMARFLTTFYATPQLARILTT